MDKGFSLDEAGWLNAARRVDSPNCDDRPDGMAVELVVIHNISLPPGCFAGDGIIELFTNRLDPAAHPYYATIKDLRVSAHFLVRRDGEIIQFVSCDQRAWHAGLSHWRGRGRCNDFSIGIELEGADETPFDDIQYERLNGLLAALCERYPVAATAGHSDIAPGRKTDPGPYFEWERIRPLGPEFPNRSA
jgi:AmpD protein